MTKKTKTPKPLLTVKIVGEGISPGAVLLRHLASVLEAAASALEASAKEAGVDVPAVSLTKIRTGSAAYDLNSSSPAAETAVRILCQAVRTRGSGHSPDVRQALQRIFDAGRVGTVTLEPRKGILRGGKPLIVSAPLEPTTETSFEIGSEVYGRIVGILARSEDTAIRLRLADGGTKEFLAADGVEAAAIRLFNRNVRARVVYEVEVGGKRPTVVEQLVAWESDDLLDVLRDLRDELAADGETIDARAWLEELDA